ncbi:MAG: electron transfer flavoprotein subunit alpha/FixB family protein [Chloroflexi bacterium]|nr:electron transfer flavoprotein subunit alpha/FixB family protein [Chloroflexota bacterium]
MIIGLIEHHRGKVNELSLEMLTLGRQLAERLQLPLHVVAIGAALRQAQGALVEPLSAYGVSTAHLIEHERLDEYAPEAWAQGVVELIGALKPQAVLAAASERGHEVMAHVAARAQLPLAANCTEIQPGDPYLVTRLRWGGSLLEEARLDGATKLLTVAPHAVPAEPCPRVEGFSGALTINVVRPELGDKDLRVRVTRRIESAPGAVSLAEARLVVGGGRGVGSAEGFKELEELAGLLGGVVGGSRVATSLGWRAHADQVGQTGTRIAPELYIACGISGAIQHMVGCKSAKQILVINTDRDAPIIAKADYAVIGDLHQIIPALSAAIRKAKGIRSRE